MASSAFNSGEEPETKHALSHQHKFEENFKEIKRVDVYDLVNCNPDDLKKYDLFLQTKCLCPVSIIAVKSQVSIEFMNQWLLGRLNQCDNDDICLLPLKTPKIESTVIAVRAESDNVYDTCQTRIIWNRHPNHHRNHSVSLCPNATYRADQVKRRLQQKLERKTVQHRTEEKVYSKSSDTTCKYSCCLNDTNGKRHKRARKRQKSSKVDAESDEEQVGNLVEDPANEQVEHHSNATDVNVESSTVHKKDKKSVKSEENQSVVSHDNIPLPLSNATTEVDTSRKLSVRRRRSNLENQRSENLPGRGSTFTGFERRRNNDHDMVKRKQKKPFRDKSENKLSMALHEISPASGKLQENIDKNAGATSFVKGIRDLTNLPSDEMRWPVTITTYPAKKSKANKSGSRRNQPNRSNASRGAEGHSDSQTPPVQVTDRSSESQGLPSRDLIVTSSQTVFGSITASLLPIPAIMSVDDEQAMISRLRGEPRTLTRDRPAVRPRHPEYSNQPARLESFRNWPASTGQDASRMAVYGFFYTGQIDLIRCFQCGIGLKDWSGTDEPLFEHIRHSAQCPFLKELLGNDLLNAYRENLHMNNDERGENSSQDANRVRNPRYDTLQSRLDSFHNWPSTARQTPNALANAGLFYTGFNDLCRCYHCDGGLQRWEADDVPWVEHARWFPNCNYVRQIKGQAFIDMVRRAAEVAQREDEDLPVFANKIRERQQGLQQQGSNPTGQLTRALNTLTLYQQELNTAALGAVELGFSRTAVQQAIDEYNNKGDRQSHTYTTEDLVNILTARIDRGETLPTDTAETEVNSAASNMDPEEENKRLKGMVKCMECGVNDTNILFLPCTHHKMCESCAESVTHCPVCKRKIEDKIKTFMS